MSDDNGTVWFVEDAREALHAEVVVPNESYVYVKDRGRRRYIPWHQVEEVEKDV